MTIDDELLLALVEPDERGFIPLQKIVNHKNIFYVIEDLNYQRLPNSNKVMRICPDLVVELLEEKPTNDKSYAIIELENDYKWDFADSLRQIKHYKILVRKRANTRKFIAIIPDVYKRYAELYKKEGIDVWTWKANRVWECMKCGKIKVSEFISQPKKCPSNDCDSREMRLAGIKDVIFTHMEIPYMALRIN